MRPAWLTADLLGRALRYAVLGSMSVAVFVWGTPLLIERYGISAALAGVLLSLTTNVINYLGNYFWAFRSQRPHRIAATRYATVILLNIGLNALMMWLALDVLHWPYWMLYVCLTAIPGVNFILYNWWAFRDGT